MDFFKEWMQSFEQKEVVLNVYLLLVYALFSKRVVMEAAGVPVGLRPPSTPADILSLLAGSNKGIGRPDRGVALAAARLASPPARMLSPL